MGETENETVAIASSVPLGAASMDLEQDLPISDRIKGPLARWLVQYNLQGCQYGSSDRSEDCDPTYGWGAHIDEWQTAGSWEKTLASKHINWLELEAVFRGLRVFIDLIRNSSVLVRTDNSTAVSYINKKGGTQSPSLCLLTWDIMMWCMQNGVTIKAVHIPGKRNGIADGLSRHRIRHTEWQLDPARVRPIFAVLGTP